MVEGYFLETFLAGYHGVSSRSIQLEGLITSLQPLYHLNLVFLFKWES